MKKQLVSLDSSKFGTIPTSSLQHIQGGMFSRASDGGEYSGSGPNRGRKYTCDSLTYDDTGLYVSTTYTWAP